MNNLDTENTDHTK